jgi:hypothetical protein
VPNQRQALVEEFPLRLRMGGLFLFSLLAVSQALAQQAKPGVLSPEEIDHTAPSAYFFRGQTATVQLRNTVGFRVGGEKLVLAGLVDTGGYSTDIKEKYQGFLITEVKLSVGGKELGPGQYGFGFSKDDEFLVMDVGANDLFRAAAHRDDKLQRPRPLRVQEDSSGYRLYAGRQWVNLKVE